ncbi:DUF4861 domain-containing protein [Marinoscillum sp.]|uniref:DUF4861 domain-containing protein n=1 Tax=Marinoscillum sp. TaxID=2024838 RepID=UPI003BABF596
MKTSNHIILTIGAVVALASCQPKEVALVITSNEAFDVSAKRVILSREDIASTEGQYFKLLYEGREVPVQFDDLDDDGQWDEVVFEVDIAPNSATHLKMEMTDAKPEYEQKTQVYLGVSPERNGQFSEQDQALRPEGHVAQSLPYLYQYEGPGWESDLVAFRSYFDSRNGKDIFGKTKTQLYADQIGLSENYHELDDWGMDVLKVGNSLGSGALAILKNDTLFRLGETGTASYSVIAEGPVRSVFELRYSGWDISGASYDVTEQISIWAGKRSFQSTVKLSSSGGDTLVTGIVNLKKLMKKESREGDYQILYTHGVQSENNDVLGMGLLVSEEHFIGFDNADSMNGGDVSDTYTALLQTDETGQYKFHFVAGWELENAKFKNEEAFLAALKQEAQELSTDIFISIQ